MMFDHGNETRDIVESANREELIKQQAEQIRILEHARDNMNVGLTKLEAENKQLKELLEQALVYLPHNRTTTDLLPDRIKRALAAPPQKGQDDEEKNCTSDGERILYRQEPS